MRFGLPVRALTLAAAITVGLGAVEGPVRASPIVQARLAEHHRLQRDIARVRRDARGHLRLVTRELRSVERSLASGPPRVSANDAAWWSLHRRSLLRTRRRLATSIRRIDHSARSRVEALGDRATSIEAWLQVWGILRVCPVAGPLVVTADFGVMVRKPGVPLHIHQGNDITAAYGTPIVTPFPGTAVTSPSALGGLAVKVYGDRGYVYNAHLSAYGHLGTVRTGEVIGYVGATGDAGGPHDHFEWHPSGGPAVDPNPYLALVC
jgi:hypothetical protein